MFVVEAIQSKPNRTDITGLINFKTIMVKN